MGTLASQTEIGVWVYKHRGRLGRVAHSSYGGPGITARKNVEIVCAKFCSLVHFWPDNGWHCRPYCVRNHFNNVP